MKTKVEIEGILVQKSEPRDTIHNDYSTIITVAVNFYSNKTKEQKGSIYPVFVYYHEEKEVKANVGDKVLVKGRFSLGNGNQPFRFIADELIVLEKKWMIYNIKKSERRLNHLWVQ